MDEGADLPEVGPTLLAALHTSATDDLGDPKVPVAANMVLRGRMGVRSSQCDERRTQVKGGRVMV